MSNHQEVSRTLETKINYAAKLLGDRGWDFIEIPLRSSYKELPSAVFKQTFVDITKRVNSKGLYLANEIGKAHLSEFAHVRLYVKYPDKPPRGCTCPRELASMPWALRFPASMPMPVRDVQPTRARVTGGITLAGALQGAKPRVAPATIAPTKHEEVKPVQVPIFKESKLVALKTGSHNQKCAAYPGCFCC